jgi:PAS domain S-box-containing protein
MASVLIIDDEKSIRLTLSAFLRAKGHDVREAEDAEAAQRILTGQHIDIVVTDIILPRVNGVKLLKTIRAAAPEVVVIMMTGEPTVDTAAESLRAGAFDYLVKPVTKQIVCQVVDRAAHLKEVTDEKKRLELENIEYRDHLESLVRERTDELIKSKEQLKTVFSSSGDFLMLLDRNHRILMVNRAEDGLSIDRLVSKPLYELATSSDDRVRVKSVLDKVVETGKTQQYDTQYTHPDGRTVHFSSVAAAVTVAGDITGSVVSARDVTEDKNTQAQLAQSDRLASMGMLAAGVAHEINNPLAYILYNLETLSVDLPALLDAIRNYQAKVNDRYGPDSVDEAVVDAGKAIAPAMLSDIKDRFLDALGGTQRIREIARGLGTFSRVERDELLPVNLTHVIEAALNMCLNEIKYRARMVKDYGKIPTVTASEGRLSQVFLNLLVNAAHAIDEGDVEGNEIRVRTWTEGETVCAEVRDTGKGIAPEHIDHLFEPFFTTKEIGEGSGLGLPISKGIIEGYGGTITVESEADKGTTFLVRIPVRAVQDATTPPVEAAAVREQVRGRILIVDDEAPIRAIMARILRGHETVLASTGENAKQILENDQKFDLILCDMMMPKVSGMDLHAWLLQEIPRLAKQLIFVTGGAFTPRAREYLEKIDNIRLEKPFDVTKFISVVNDQLQQPPDLP